MFLSKGIHVFAFTSLPSLRFIFDLLLSYFDILISKDSLISLLLYLAFLDNVFGCSKLNLATETCAIDLENSSKETDAECLCQKVSRILNRNLNVKLRDNLSNPQRKALVQKKSNKDTTIDPFNKGLGFVVLSEKNARESENSRK